MVLETIRYLTKEFKACLTLEDRFIEKETFSFLGSFFLSERISQAEWLPFYGTVLLRRVYMCYVYVTLHNSVLLLIKIVIFYIFEPAYLYTLYKCRTTQAECVI